MKISIITISYNALSHFQINEDLLKKIFSTKYYYEFELIIVDNASYDDSPRMIEDFKKKYPKIKTVYFDTPHELHDIYSSCIELASGDIIFTLDIDDISQALKIDKLVPMLEYYDFIHGVRVNRSCGLRLILSKIFNFIYRYILNYKLRDIGYNFYFCKKEKNPYISNFYKKNNIKLAPVIFEILNYKFKEINVEFSSKGKSTYSLFKLLKVASFFMEQCIRGKFIISSCRKSRR